MKALDPALVEWLRYLRDLGVRELRVGAQAGAGSSAAAPAPGRERPRGGAASAAPFLLADAGTAGLPGFEDGGALPPGERLARVREALGDCTRCKLHGGRTKLVFGVGDPAARLLFVGEGPGAEEDARGEPFVGRAGQKLDDMIRAIGLERSQVYIANVVKCRPPGNRDPEPDEVETCSPFLVAQIEAVRPRVIVTLGLPAARTLLGLRGGIGAARGRWHSFRGIPVMPTFHPAYLLRAYTPENRRKVWEDLKAARTRLDEA